MIAMPRPDPRAEPESDSETSTPQVSVERVVVSKIDAPKIDTEDEESPAPSSQRTVTVKSEDPRVAEIEPLVERGDWKAVVQKLGAVEDAGKLPPNLGLLAALAHNEIAKDGSVEARNVAVRSMAALLGQPPDSELPRVLARRLLRKAPPPGFRQRPAPPPRTSLVIVAIVLVLAGALGWFLSSPSATRLLHELLR